MTKKTVFLLQGSPRKKGNTNLLSDKFLQGVTYSGNTYKKNI